MNDALKKVTEFRNLVKLPVSEKLEPLTFDKVELHTRLIRDEVNELYESLEVDSNIKDLIYLCKISESKEKIEYYQNLLDQKTENKKYEILSKQVDTLIDVIYYSLGALADIGVKNVDELFNIVHDANMTKGQFKLNYKEGKLEKPEGFIPPDKHIECYLEAIDI